MNELKKIKDKMLNNNLKVRKKEKDLIVTEQYKTLMKSEGIVLF